MIFAPGGSWSFCSSSTGIWARFLTAWACAFSGGGAARAVAARTTRTVKTLTAILPFIDVVSLQAGNVFGGHDRTPGPSGAEREAHVGPHGITRPETPDSCRRSAPQPVGRCEHRPPHGPERAFGLAPRHLLANAGLSRPPLGRQSTRGPDASRSSARRWPRRIAAAAARPASPRTAARYQSARRSSVAGVQRRQVQAVRERPERTQARRRHVLEVERRARPRAGHGAEPVHGHHLRRKQQPPAAAAQAQAEVHVLVVEEVARVEAARPAPRLGADRERRTGHEADRPRLGGRRAGGCLAHRAGQPVHAAARVPERPAGPVQVERAGRQPDTGMANGVDRRVEVPVRHLDVVVEHDDRVEAAEAERRDAGVDARAETGVAPKRHDLGAAPRPGPERAAVVHHHHPPGGARAVPLAAPPGTPRSAPGRRSGRSRRRHAPRPRPARSFELRAGRRRRLDPPRPAHGERRDGDAGRETERPHRHRDHGAPHRAPARDHGQVRGRASRQQDSLAAPATSSAARTPRPPRRAPS